MWPWGHLAVAYLAYAALVRRRFGRPPRDLPVAALAVGSQFPDLIDKPLAWSLGVLPGGRTLAHSLFLAALLLPATYAVAARIDRVEVATAFLVGHLSHLVADVPPAALSGEVEGAAYLLWPVAEPPVDPTGSLLEGLLRLSVGPFEWFQFVLLALAAALWYRDGMPGAIRPAPGRFASAER